MKRLLYFLVFLALLCACKKHGETNEAKIQIGPDTVMACPSNYTQFERSYLDKSRFVSEAKIFLPGGVVILTSADMFIWRRDAPKWAKYSKVRQWKNVTINGALSVMLDGHTAEPEAYVEREGF